MSRNEARPAGRGRPAKGKRRGRPGDGLETAADGTVIGQDPRSLTPPELRELGHRGKPLLQAMRRRCVDCCGGKADEVRRCTAVACPLWPYRMGTDPWHAEPAATKGMAAAPAPETSLAGPDAASAPQRVANGTTRKDAAAAPAAGRPRRGAEAAEELERKAEPAPAPHAPAAAAARAAGRRRNRRPTEAPLLPFLDDAPA